MITGEGRWVGRSRLLLATRRARRAGDTGAVLRAVAGSSRTAVGLRLKSHHVLLVLDPALVGDVLAGHAADTVKGPGVQLTRDLLGSGLLTSEGADHRRARKLVAPAFSPRRLAGYTDVFAGTTLERSDRWTDGAEVDMAHEMATLTLAMVGRTLLGVDLTAEAPDVRAGLESALGRFGGGEGPLFAGRRPEQPPPDGAAAVVHDLVDRVIAERRLGRYDDRGDVISALLGSQDTGGLSEAEVHDHVMTLLMAGHETTANALTWTWHLLADRPDVQRRLAEEADALPGPGPSYGDPAALPYTRAVLSEAMRLYPPAWIIGRTTTAEITVGRWTMPAGSLVAVSPLLLHRDRRWFPEPDRFDPDRWLDDRRHKVPRHAYLPFGTGPRACVGEQFAWAEAVTALAVLAGRWTASADPVHQVRPHYRVTMRPSGGLPMTLHARCNAALG